MHQRKRKKRKRKKGPGPCWDKWTNGSYIALVSWVASQNLRQLLCTPQTVRCTRDVDSGASSKPKTWTPPEGAKGDQGCPSLQCPLPVRRPAGTGWNCHPSSGQPESREKRRRGITVRALQPLSLRFTTASFPPWPGSARSCSLCLPGPIEPTSMLKPSTYSTPSSVPRSLRAAIDV